MCWFHPQLLQQALVVEEQLRKAAAENKIPINGGSQSAEKNPQKEDRWELW